MLGDKSAIEVLTGRQPDNAVKCAVWAGTRLKNARRGDISLELVTKHCERLEASLAVLHEHVRNEETQCRRKQALCESRGSPMRFSVGDLVMVSAEKNMANPIRHSKVMCRWQGPYEVVRAVNEVSYVVRLLGDARESVVHWRKMRRLAGPGLAVTKELVEGAQHDLQKFKVEKFLDWAVNTDGEVDMLVQWRGHDDTNNTWEPLTQLVADVPALVAKYVKMNAGWPDLDREYKKAVRASRKKTKGKKKT